MPTTQTGISTGVALAVSTAVLWAISPLFIASVGRRIGSFATNVLRATIAAVILVAVVLPGWMVIAPGRVIWPGWAAVEWIVASGVVGWVVGDAFFYEALVLLGPRRAVKVNTLAPVVALAAGWVWQGETLSLRALAGAAMVIAAVMYATFANTSPGGAATREPGGMSAGGLACGIASAVCIALGSVLGREAYKAAPDGRLDPMLATTLRVGSAAVLLWVWPVVRGRAGEFFGHLVRPGVRGRLFAGTAMGALGGMMCYVSALKYAPAGLVSTIVATSPLVIIPLVAVRYRVRVGVGIVIAAIVAVVGVGLISWK
jgi:drug/metabolite transporter (DMT)-like permease